MGQWTNRLYEYFREPESQTFSTKRLSASLRKHRQQLKAQVHHRHGRGGQRRGPPEANPDVSLHKHSRVPSLQEDLFSAAKSNEVVASNEDDAVELMMYRQRSFGSDEVSPCEPESQDPPEPLPDELGPAERGEAPPLREVRNQDKCQLGLFF